MADGTKIENPCGMRLPGPLPHVPAYYWTSTGQTHRCIYCGLDLTPQPRTITTGNTDSGENKLLTSSAPASRREMAQHIVDLHNERLEQADRIAELERERDKANEQVEALRERLIDAGIELAEANVRPLTPEGEPVERRREALQLQAERDFTQELERAAARAVARNLKAQLAEANEQIEALPKCHNFKPEGLDRIYLYIHDFGKNEQAHTAAMFTFAVFGDAWSAGFGAIGGDRTPEQFLMSAHTDYLVRKFIRGDITEVDYEAMSDKTGLDVNVATALDHFDEIAEHYGPDWMMDMPQRLTSEYRYLTRIIDAIKFHLSNTQDSGEGDG